MAEGIGFIATARELTEKAARIINPEPVAMHLAAAVLEPQEAPPAPAPTRNDAAILSRRVRLAQAKPGIR